MAIIERHDGYTYYRHRQTGLVYALPFPTERILSDYYDGFLFQQPASTAFHRMRSEVAKATSNITAELIQNHRANTESLLDYGGGLGFYSDGFSKHFRQVTLCDVDPKACEYARETFPGAFDVVQGEPGKPVPSDRRFDVVFASHVIEHCVDLPSFFAILHKQVKLGGLIVVATPNNATWEYIARPNLIIHYLKRTAGNRLSRLPLAFGKIFTNSWLCCDPPRHIYALNASALCAMAEDAGFKVQVTFTEYSWHSKYSRVNEQSIEAGQNLLKRLLRVILNVYARITLPLLVLIDKKGTKGGNLVLIARLS